MAGIYLIPERSEAPNIEGRQRAEAEVEIGEILMGGTSGNGGADDCQRLARTIPRKGGTAGKDVWFRSILRTCPKEHRISGNT